MGKRVYTRPDLPAQEMTLRDYYAAAALAALPAHDLGDYVDAVMDASARLCYGFADAMLRVRDAQPERPAAAATAEAAE